MTTEDEHRVAQTAKAERYIAGILERFAGLQPDQRPDPARIAAAAVTELRDYGWRLPQLLNPAPSPRGQAETSGPGYAAFQAERERLAARRATEHGPT